MPFRGKPSKACERCRARRIKCSLHAPSCTQCLRAQVLCPGYRDTSQLRVRNESAFVVSKHKARSAPSTSTSSSSSLSSVSSSSSQHSSITSPLSPSPAPSSSTPLSPSFSDSPLSPSSPSSTQSPIITTSPLTTHLPPSNSHLARTAFYAYYVTSTTRCFDFLKRYYHNPDTPPHLSLAIDAVSLAYLWHLVDSPSALQQARQRYGRALRGVRGVLGRGLGLGGSGGGGGKGIAGGKRRGRGREREKDKTEVVMSCLVLDLFEKIVSTGYMTSYSTSSSSSPSSSSDWNSTSFALQTSSAASTPTSTSTWTSHIHGALALVRLRGLSSFELHPQTPSSTHDSDPPPTPTPDPHTFPILTRLSGNALISCIAAGIPVPSELLSIRTFTARFLNTDEPMWRLSELMVGYAALCALASALESDDEMKYTYAQKRNRCRDWLSKATTLDQEIAAVDAQMPESWGFESIFLPKVHNAEIKPETGAKRAAETENEELDRRIDVYPNRTVSQVRNFVRMVRVLLNEGIVEFWGRILDSFDNYVGDGNSGRRDTAADAHEATAGIQTATAQLDTLTREICASVLGVIQCVNTNTNPIMMHTDYRISSAEPKGKMSDLYTPDSNSPPDSLGKDESSTTKAEDDERPSLISFFPSPPSYLHSHPDQPHHGYTKDHPHTPTHRLQVYTLLFPLFIIGRLSSSCYTHSLLSQKNVRKWIIDKLRVIAEHFGIREAEGVACLLEGLGLDGDLGLEAREGGLGVSWEGGHGHEHRKELSFRERHEQVWGVYKALGGYAFGA